MDELYFWIAAVVVGFVLLKAIPAKKMAGLNKRMREKIPGFLLAILFILIGAFFIAGIYFLCDFLDTPKVLTRILTGAILGAFIGFIPLVDGRNTKDGEKK